MINEILLMNGYGLYVWSAFTFTLLSFVSLYVVIRAQYIKEMTKYYERVRKEMERERQRTQQKERKATNNKQIYD